MKNSTLSPFTAYAPNAKDSAGKPTDTADAPTESTPTEEQKQTRNRMTHEKWVALAAKPIDDSYSAEDKLADLFEARKVYKEGVIRASEALESGQKFLTVLDGHVKETVKKLGG